MAVSQGTMNKAFVSAIDFLDQRDIDPKIYDVARDRSLVDVMSLVGRYKPCTMYNYHNFINNNVWETATVSSVTTTGLAQIQFAVSTGSGYPRVGDLIKTSNSNNVGKQARIQAVSLASGVATLTVRTPNNVPFFATTNDIVSFQSNAYGEGSGTPTNRKYAVTKYFNLIQIFKEIDNITDVQKVAKIEVEVNGDYHILPYQIVQKLTYMKGIISAQMIAGIQSGTQFGDSNPFLADADGNPIQTTGGLDWYVTTYGINDSVATLGTLALTDLDEIIDNWIAAKAPLDQMAFSGIKPKRAFDKLVKNLGSSGITSVRLVLDGNSADFNVDHLSYSGAEMDFVYLPIIDHPQLFGPTLTPDINGSFYWVPKDQIQTVGGGMEPRMQIRHTDSPFMGGGTSANGSSNGIISEWRLGALAGVPTDGIAHLQTNWYTAQGLECIGVQHFQKYRVV